MHYKKKAYKATVSLLATFALLTGIFGIGEVFVSAQGHSISISSSEDLEELSKNCVLDTYSKELVVKLIADIDLTDSDFTPIPIFFGTFDGKGHTITGLEVTDIGSKLGLFRTVEDGAVIKNLTVEGTVSPKGTACYIGMIAGENSGLINNCTVSGNITGENEIGGITGLNTGAGIISSCTSNATVSGMLNTGGTVGGNDGIITNCTNNGSINTTSRQQAESPMLKDFSSLTDTITDSMAEAITGLGHSEEEPQIKDEPETANDVSNTGGIAGRSTGIIRGSSNYGIIGYEHVGYNTGGVAGTQNGIITNCENYGDVFGRKDVGGIVGQFEPDIVLEYDEYSKKDLEEEFSKLNELLRRLANSITGSIGNSLQHAATINQASANISDSLNVIIGSQENEDSTTSDGLLTLLKSFDNSYTKMKNLDDEFDKTSTVEMAKILAYLKELETDIDAAGATENSDEIKAQMANIVVSRKNISKSLKSVKELADEIGDSAKKGSLTITERYEEAKRLVGNYDFDGELDTITYELGRITTASSTIETQVGILNEKVGTYNPDDEETLTKLSQSAATLNTAAEEYATGMNAEIPVIRDIFHSIENRLDQVADDGFSSIYDELTIINNSMTSMVNEGIASNNNINAIMNSVIDQLDVVGKTMSAMMGTPEYTSVDISDEIELEEKPGQISNCRNIGTISSDTNGGGITGMMAMEVGNDPEEDFSMNEGLWVDTTALFRAIVMNCSNWGKIYVKNDNGGGVVGRCEVGAIYKAENMGDVSTTNGSKCGGIAGFCEGLIKMCGAQSNLVGGDYVGGIVGLGLNISDCRSMVRIESDGECIGAIAGDATGKIKGNIFVKEDLAGIDGVSYEEKAYALPYNEFIKLDELPYYFLNLNLNFYVDDFLLVRIPVVYGGSVSESDIPEIPKKENSFGYWEDFDTENLIRSQRVNAIYESWINTLASGETLPRLLAEGNFSNQGKVLVETLEGGGLHAFTSIVTERFNFSVSDPVNPTMGGPLTLRLRCEDKGADRVTIISEDGNSITIKPHRDGSYLVFETDIHSGRILVLKSIAPYIILTFTAILVILMVLWLVSLIKKRRKGQLVGAIASSSKNFNAHVAPKFKLTRSDKHKNKQ